jgi:hypothetical protein
MMEDIMTTDPSKSKLEQAFGFDFPTKTAPTATSSGTGGGASSSGGFDGIGAIDNNSSAFGTGQNGTDPWSDETWGRGALLINAADVETVETEDVFEFSTDNGNVDSLLLEELLVDDQHQHLDNGEGEEASRLFFPSADDFFREVPEDPATVHVAIHEQLSAIYDDISEDPACQVEGSIHVKPSAEMGNSPFSLVLRDLMGHLKNVKDRTDFCQDVTDKVSRQGLHKSDRVFRVMLPPNVLANGEVPIAKYICSSRVRPVPLVRG